mmetsp:Transcript_8187/g.13229  ORF Transcript_8187/g.13229 Transcript_8187/m.13229 type:complete len:436 (+) Transcript_8187:468-1775(+)
MGRGSRTTCADPTDMIELEGFTAQGARSECSNGLIEQGDEMYRNKRQVSGSNTRTLPSTETTDEVDEFDFQPQNTNQGSLWIKFLEKDVCGKGYESADDYEADAFEEARYSKKRRSICRCCRVLECMVFFIMLFVILTLVLTVKQNICWNGKDEMDLYYNLLKQAGNDVYVSPIPLMHAHSHNDYQQSSPLHLATSAGFCSVEADVHYSDFELYTGHLVASDIKLKDQYLLPMARMTNATRGPINPLAIRIGVCLQQTLLVDMKSQNVVTSWETLENLLKTINNEMGFNTFECYNSRGIPIPESRSKTGKSPIRVIVTGVSRDEMPQLANEMLKRDEGKHCTTLDGRWGDDMQLGKDENVRIAMSWVSAKWDEDKFTTDNLQRMVERAHAQKVKVRFWGTPENVVTWTMLLDAGVDLISTDRIAGLQAFLLGRKY